MRPPMRPLPNRRPSAPGAARRHPSVGMAGRGAAEAAVDSRFRGNDEERGGGNDGLGRGGKDGLVGYRKGGLRAVGRGAVDAAVGSRFRGNDEERGGGNDEPGNCVNEGPGDGGLRETGRLRRPGG